MAQLRQKHEFFKSKGVQLVAVGMGNPADARSFKQSRNLPFPLLSDSPQRVYRQFGLGMASAIQEFQSNTAGALLREASRGNFAGIPVGDVTQLGGTFLIDQQGIARFVHRDRSTSEPASLPALVKAVEGL